MIDMSKKELSPFAPDRWIRQLNRMIPNLWTDLRKTYADPTRLMKPDSGAMELLHFVPEWDFMPTMFPFFLCTVRYGEAYYLQHMNEIMTIATLYTWRVSKGVYRFAPEVYDALVNQPLSGDLPCDCLYRLPGWAVYIEAHGLMFERVPLEGFIAHLDYNLFSRDIDLQFALFAKNCNQPRMIALPMGTGSLTDALERVDAIDKAFIPGNQPHYVGTKEEYRYTFSAMLQLLLYLCSDEPDMPPIEHPQKRKSASGRVYPPDEPKVWDVGVRISNVIRGYRHETTLNERAETTSEQSHAARVRMSVPHTGIPTGRGRATLCFPTASPSSVGCRLCPSAWTGNENSPPISAGSFGRSMTMKIARGLTKTADGRFTCSAGMLQRHFKVILRFVIRMNAVIYITRKGKNDLVLMSYDYYLQWTKELDRIKDEIRRLCREKTD